MKHNFTSRDGGVLRAFAMPIILLTFFLLCLAQSIIAQCTLACHNQINLSISEDCNAEVTYEMMLQSPNNPNTCSPTGSAFFFEVVVMDTDGVSVLPTSPFVTDSEVGLTLSVKVRHLPSGNQCWGTVLVEDKLAPVLTCPGDLTVQCTQATDSGITGVPTVQECSDFTLNISDQNIDLGCGDPTRQIIRTFLATDEFGYASSCTQTISVADPDIFAVQFPPNFDNNEQPALPCETVAANPDLTEPDNTGFPTLSGEPIEPGANPCGLNIGFTDNIIEVCDGTYKILRQWTILEWCTSTVRNDTQIIKVEDDDGPTLTCQAEINAGTTASLTCTAAVLLPPANISDLCSGIAQVQIFSQYGSVSGNGGVISGFPVGTHTVTYQATDNCNNTSTCITALTVSDDDSPTVVCDEFTVVTLNASGMAFVNAETFDDGSYDNCCLEDFLVRRVDPGCGTGNNFAEQVKFCCADIGQPVTVELRVTDCYDNANTCMVTATVEENTAPLISCPSTVVLECTEDFTDLALTGEPLVLDACGATAPTFTDAVNLNACNSGTVIRTFSTADSQGNGNTCSQTIILEDNTPFSVNFPPDYDAPACTSPEDLDPEDLPAGFGFPTYNNDDCEQLALNISDEIFTAAPPACYKIVRTFTVIDWCVYDAANPDGPGQFSASQEIRIMDNEAPEVTCASDFTVSTSAENCLATVTFPAPTATDCSENIQISVNNPLGVGSGPFSDVVPGIYTATYFVSDGCGNTATCTTTVTVEENSLPTPYCISGLVLELSPIDLDGDGNPDDGSTEIWASDFDAGSFDNCGGEVTVSFSPDVNDVGATYTCDDAGINPVFLYVTDADGNQDVCETTVLIESVDNVCGGEDGGLFMIAGAIADENGNMLENTEVQINEGMTATEMTDADGYYDFAEMAAGQNFTVSPLRTHDPMNGVSTFDLVLIRQHILNTEILDSPYKIIAADINNNGAVSTADIVELRKLILTIYDDFPANTAWKFVDADYEFADPLNPTDSGFPQAYSINNLTNDMTGIDFIAVKIGDVNGTALTSELQTENGEERSGTALNFFAEDQTLNAGADYVIPVFAECPAEIISGQFTLAFEEESIDFHRIEPATESDFHRKDFSLHAVDQGYLTAAWYRETAENFVENTAVFYLHITAKADANLRDILQINSAKTPAIAYTDAGKTANVNLNFRKANVGQSLALQVLPNPFIETTCLVFALSDSTDAEMTISDARSRIIFTKTGFSQDDNTLTLPENLFSVRGIYYCRLRTRGGTVVKKLLKL